MLDFFSAYVVTITLEAVIAILLLKGKYEERLIARNAVIASSLTLPFVWFVFPALLSESWALQTTVAEVFAFVVEAGVYRALFPKMGWVDALKVSLICNAASFLVGLAL